MNETDKTQWAEEVLQDVQAQRATPYMIEFFESFTEPYTAEDDATMAGYILTCDDEALGRMVRERCITYLRACAPD